MDFSFLDKTRVEELKNILTNSCKHKKELKLSPDQAELILNLVVQYERRLDWEKSNSKLF